MFSNASANLSTPVNCHWVMRFVPVQVQGVVYGWPPLQGFSPSKFPQCLHGKVFLSLCEDKGCA